MKTSGNNPLASSDLPETILKTNPGVDKKTKISIALSNRLATKINRSTDYKRKLFCLNFEQNRNRRNKLYERLKPKLSSSSRN